MKNPFSEIGEEYDVWYGDPLGAHVEATERALLMELLLPQHGETIVDIGAGTGRLAQHLAEQARARVIAVEPSPSMRKIGEARTEGLEVEWHTAVAEELPLADGSVDAALLVTVLEFVQDPSGAVREARRVLRAGGRLVVGALSALSGWGALYRHLADGGVDPWASARFWTRDSLGGLLGLAPDGVQGALLLSPGARPPYAEAEAAGRRAGNEPAFLVARWDKV